MREILGELDGGLDEFDGATGTVKTAIDVAKEAGFNNKRSVENRAAIADLPQNLRDIIRDKSIADRLNELLSLTRLDEDDLERVTEVFASGNAETLGEARRYIDGPVEKPPTEDGPGTDVGERYKVVRLEGPLRWPAASWYTRNRWINGEERQYPREDEWLERDLILTTDERALDPETGLEYVVEDFARQFRKWLLEIGYPRKNPR